MKNFTLSNTRLSTRRGLMRLFQLNWSFQHVVAAVWYILFFEDLFSINLQ